MVVLHVKSTTSSSPSPSSEEETEFLHECAATAAVADVAAAVAGTAGLQARVLSLCRRLRERCADAGAAGGELERALSEAEAYASKNLQLDMIVPCFGFSVEDVEICLNRVPGTSAA